MGINVNVSPTIQQNTPLRGVRSGSTAEPDYNVKYVPQSLTESQKAQARQNIGVEAGEQVQANWNETDTTSPAYIQNKPSIPAAPVQSNWNETDTASLAYIQNKPTFADVPNDMNVVTLKLSSATPISLTRGWGSNPDLVKIFIDGEEITWNEGQDNTMVTSKTYSSGKHIVEYLVIDNNHRYVAGAFCFITGNVCEKMSSRCDYLSYQQGAANNRGLDRLAIPYSTMSQNKYSAGSIDGVVVRGNVEVDNAWQSSRIYFTNQTPYDIDQTYTDNPVIYVPLGTGAAWAALNADTTVYEYLNLIYPNEGTIIYKYLDVNGSDTNPAWAMSQPLVVGASLVELTMTDENSNVISGNFVAQGVTITPAS